MDKRVFRPSTSTRAPRKEELLLPKGRVEPRVDSAQGAESAFAGGDYGTAAGQAEQDPRQRGVLEFYEWVVWGSQSWLQATFKVASAVAQTLVCAGPPGPALRRAKFVAMCCRPLRLRLRITAWRPFQDALPPTLVCLSLRSAAARDGDTGNRLAAFPGSQANFSRDGPWPKDR